jgi:GNAT superfamily N-acetyltransferase
MPWLELKLSAQDFARLPRNAAYRYQYQAGSAWVNPRPRYYHCLLELPGLKLTGRADVAVRGLREDDWEPLVWLFADAFREQQPFAGLADDTRLVAAQRSLEQTRRGGDGPWIEQASFAACAEEGGLVGAVLITLLPRRDPTDWDSYSWEKPPPPDAVARRLGRPHLTWMFVRSDSAGRGVGTALLAAAARALLGLGYRELLSTFMLGNESSMLWHWRSGFRLLAYPGSQRRGAP